MINGKEGKSERVIRETGKREMGKNLSALFAVYPVTLFPLPLR
jgi:hypothetical protein